MTFSRGLPPLESWLVTSCRVPSVVMQSWQLPAPAQLLSWQLQLQVMAGHALAQALSHTSRKRSRFHNILKWISIRYTFLDVSWRVPVAVQRCGPWHGRGQDVRRVSQVQRPVTQSRIFCAEFGGFMVETWILYNLVSKRLLLTCGGLWSYPNFYVKCLEEVSLSISHPFW